MALHFDVLVAQMKEYQGKMETMSKSMKFLMKTMKAAAQEEVAIVKVKNKERMAPLLAAEYLYSKNLTEEAPQTVDPAFASIVTEERARARGVKAFRRGTARGGGKTYPEANM